MGYSWIFFLVLVVLFVVGAMRASAVRRVIRRRIREREVTLRSMGLDPVVAREQLQDRLTQTLATAAGAKSIEQRLAELGDLRNRGVITDEEFTAARAKVIGSA